MNGTLSRCPLTCHSEFLWDLERGTGLESPAHEDNRSGHRHHHEDLVADPLGQVRKITAK